MKIDNGAGGSRETSTGGSGSRPGLSAVDERGRESINFFAEVKRRNVYKVAVAYAVVAWLLIQVATQVFPFFEIPNWAVRLVVLAVIAGFPIALVVAWAFELTPQGLKRTEDVDLAPQPRRKSYAWVYVVIVGAALSVGLFFVGRYTAGSKNNGVAFGESFGEVDCRAAVREHERGQSGRISQRWHDRRIAQCADQSERTARAGSQFILRFQGQ